MDYFLFMELVDDAVSTVMDEMLDGPDGGAEPLAEALNLRALEVDTAVERDEQLHGIQLVVKVRERIAAAHGLEVEIIDGVADDFEGASSLGAYGTTVGDGSGRGTDGGLSRNGKAR